MWLYYTPHNIHRQLVRNTIISSILLRVPYYFNKYIHFHMNIRISAWNIQNHRLNIIHKYWIFAFLTFPLYMI